MPKHGVVRRNPTATHSGVVSKHGSIQPEIPVIVYPRSSCSEHGSESSVKVFHRIQGWVVQRSCGMLDLEL